MSRDTTILAGKWGWVWQVSDFTGGINDCISLAKDMGYRGLIVKAADGPSVWPQFADNIAVLRGAGLEVGAWTYCYGNDAPGEANAAISALNAGASFVCLDVEREYAGKHDAAIQTGQLLRAAKPEALITFGPWCFPNDVAWENVPYDEFAKFCDAVQPQNYWSDYTPTVDVGLRQSDAQMKAWGLPIYPIGQTYAGNTYTPVKTDYNLFEQTCHSLGYTGVSFWRLGTESADMKAAVSAMTFPIVMPTQFSQSTTVPQWAQSTINKLVAKGVLKDTSGDETFYRVLVILDRLGKLD